MIHKFQITNFKRLGTKEIILKDNISLVVGGNNSGKTSVLHALAVWEYAKQVLIYEKSPRALYHGFSGDGYGVTIDDFTPINIPSFKYLWTNLKTDSGYTLEISCFWMLHEIEKYLKIGLAYGQEKLYIKPLDSNVNEGDYIPHIVYLPTFAGINSKEEWHTPAVRNKYIGQGLAGSVLRNQIMELFLQNVKIRKERKGDRSKILESDLKWIRENDAYELLNQTIFSIFKGILYPKAFNPNFHTHVLVNFRKGEIVNKRFKPIADYKERDIMVEGSGFLQWLSVYTMAVTPNIDVLLLDEPDAHLHCSLQSELFAHLQRIATLKRKQILIATHSTDIIKTYDFGRILSVSNTSIRYLASADAKIRIISGIGSEYFPLLEAVQKYKRVLFVENESDAKLLKIFCDKYSVWPNNLVVWPKANKQSERTVLYLYLKEQIHDLKCISLSDRDNELYREGTSNLHDNTPDKVEGNNELRYRKWRRWEMESYLISKPAIVRLIMNKNGVSNDDATRDFDSYAASLGIVINPDYKQSDCTVSNAPLFNMDAKALLNPICDHYGIDKYAIANEMHTEDLFDDVRTLVDEIVNMCQ
jgi:AAA15 family ATPase/GTPase